MGTKVYPEFNKQKATEAAALLMGMHGGRMSRIKLLKLLYLSDRKAFEMWERPITFDIYYSMPNGQVLSGVLDLINNKIIEPLWKKHIRQADEISVELIGKQIKVQKLSRAEIRLLEDIYSEFGHWNRFDLGKYTKGLPEYKATTSSKLTKIDELLEYIFGEEDAKRVEKKLEEKAYLEKALS